MKKSILFLFAIVCCFFVQAQAESVKIDREAVVGRHKVVTTADNPKSPAQVGNGHFAFGVDHTGLQTFIPFNTMADWSWHSFPLPEGVSLTDYEPTFLEAGERKVPYFYPDPQHPQVSSWMEGNPHRFNLGRIGFRLLKSDGSEAQAGDIKDRRQEIDLWTGIIQSSFSLEGVSVTVQTACHPYQDRVGVSVESELVKQGRLSVFLDFPYPTPDQFADYVGRYDAPQSHTSSVGMQKENLLQIFRRMDRVHYVTTLSWDTPAEVTLPSDGNSHRFGLVPQKDAGSLAFTCYFSALNGNIDGRVGAEDVFNQSKQAWSDYWNSGAAVDFSGSTDPRWQELERRVVLSEYLMRVNEAGNLPPQESGLVNNGWYGREHFEMVWWHGVHYGLWNRWSLFERSLGVYQKFLPTSIARAKEQGYKGARWPKCCGDFDRDWPHPIHATLIWQQPHPLYFAEMDYRLHPTEQTLKKWSAVVFNTADFMASFATYDEAKDRFVLGPPVYIVSENTNNLETRNPTFELGYWRYGLRIALEWQKRLGLPQNSQWVQVLEKLSPLPVEEGLYVTHEGIEDMWGKFTFEHPALTGVYGMLPGDGVELATFKATLEKVVATWNFNHTWGWDFPMLAMAAARTGQPGLALDLLLHSSPGFQFDEHGLCTGGPFPYFPANGGLLSAVAMMCGGWDGAQGVNPGFPQGEKWHVQSEGFVPMQ